MPFSEVIQVPEGRIKVIPAGYRVPTVYHGLYQPNPVRPWRHVRGRRGVAETYATKEDARLAAEAALIAAMDLT